MLVLRVNPAKRQIQDESGNPQRLRAESKYSDGNGKQRRQHDLRCG